MEKVSHNTKYLLSKEELELAVTQYLRSKYSIDLPESATVDVQPTFETREIPLPPYDCDYVKIFNGITINTSYC